MSVGDSIVIRRPGEADSERLDSYGMDEWWDVYRRVFPDGTREEFVAQWGEYVIYLLSVRRH